MLAELSPDFGTKSIVNNVFDELAKRSSGNVGCCGVASTQVISRRRLCWLKTNTLIFGLETHSYDAIELELGHIADCSGDLH